MTMLKASTIHWHNANDVPPDGEYLVYIKRSNLFTNLHVYEGHWNCYPVEMNHELKIDAWAELPNMED